MGLAEQKVDAAPRTSPSPSRTSRLRVPSSRAKDIRCHPLFRGGISQGTWRLLTYNLTPACRWFVVVTIVFTAAGSLSLDFLYYSGFCFCTGIWLVTVACGLAFRPRVKLRASHADRLGAGESLAIDIEVEQHSRFSPANMTVIPHELPDEIDATPFEGAALPALPHGQTAHARLALACKRRGVYNWSGFRVETDYPFGLIRTYRTFRRQHEVLVYPRFTQLQRLSIPSGRSYQPGGVALASNLGESFEYIGNREYREGDNVRDIDWRATARLSIPVVREYREEYLLRVAVVLDSYVPGSDPDAVENFERAVSTCAAVSDYMARSDYVVDIFAAGPHLYHLTAGRSLAYLDQILDILACVTSCREEPFDVIESELLTLMARITTILCVFTNWNEPRRAFVERLRREGAGVRVIVVRNTRCELNPADADLPDPIPVVSADDFRRGVEEL